MSCSDYDLTTLADYLHILPEQALRLAERGQVPGRRVNGAWRFAPAEIHHWLEERIGLSSAGELASLEQMLDGPRGTPPAERIVLTDLLPPEAIAPELAARTRAAVFPAVVSVAARTGLIWDEAKLVEALRQREELSSTVQESGIALLHPRRPQPGILGGPILAFGRTPSGIPFGNRHGGLTDLFFLICMLDDRSHLRALAALSRLLTDTALLNDLRTAQSASAIREAFAATEARFRTDDNPTDREP